MTAPSRRPSFTAATCPTAKAAADAGITHAYVDGNLRQPTGYTNLPYPAGWDDPAAEETLASLTVTGDVAVGGDVAVNTDKFTVAAASGNTAVAGTLAVAGNVGFYGHAVAAQPAINTAALTTITFTAPSSADYALQDLTDSGGFGFKTKDEGNSVLAVIANLQTRVAELETKQKAVGLMAAA